MKKTYSYIFILLIIGFTTGACDLDELPTGQMVAESAITDANSAENALNGTYYRFAGGGFDTYDNKTTNWFGNNEILPAQIAGMIYYSSGGLGVGLNVNVVTPQDYNIEGIWDNRYHIITAANGVLAAVEGLPDEEFLNNRKKEILGEASFLRAYGNFSLLGYFGQYYDINSVNGIILRNTLTKSTEIVKPRSTVSECYEAILSDLDFAIANAPVTNEAYYATSWAAKLLKARVLLFRGTGDDYTNAYNLALDVIDNGPYQLDQMQQLFGTNGLNSPEVILGIQPWDNQIRHQDGYINWLARQWDPNYLANETLLDLLDGDPREDWMIGTGLEGGTTLIKYEGTVKETSYALRLTEAYLIVAECAARNTQEGQAKEYLKQVLQHAGVTDFSAVDNASGEDLLYQIYTEYAKNMCTEDGLEWFAMIRLLSLENVQQLRPGIISNEQYTMPIPESELVRNTAMTQNPGYQDF